MGGWLWESFGIRSLEDEGSEFFIPVIAGIEVGHFLDDKHSQVPQKYPPIFIGQVIDTVLDQSDELRGNA